MDSAFWALQQGPGSNGKWVHLFLNKSFGKLSFRDEISPVGHSEQLTTAVKFLFCFADKELLEMVTQHLPGS